MKTNTSIVMEHVPEVGAISFGEMCARTIGKLPPSMCVRVARKRLKGRLPVDELVMAGHKVLISQAITGLIQRGTLHCVWMNGVRHVARHPMDGGSRPERSCKAKVLDALRARPVHANEFGEYPCGRCKVSLIVSGLKKAGFDIERRGELFVLNQ